MNRYLRSAFFSFLCFCLLIGGTAGRGIDIFLGKNAAAQSPETETMGLYFAEECGNENPTECPLLSADTAASVIPFHRELQEGDTLTLHLIVSNPEQKNIVTARTLLGYDPQVFEPVALLDTDSDFSLAAPGENEIVSSASQIKIGRGVDGGGRNSEKLLLATIELKVITFQGRTSRLSFVNFQPDDLGDVGVFRLNEQTLQPENILERAPQDLQFSLNGGISPNGNADPEIPDSPPENPPTNTDGTSQVPDQNMPEKSERLARPDGVRIRTLENGNTELIWDLSADPEVKGYYVYYSEESGFYIHRIDVGKTNHAEFTEFLKGKTYYFAVTAYGVNGSRESDYSDEVFATIGVPGSESHRFILDGKKNSNIEKAPMPEVDTLEETGPAESLALASAMLGLFLLFSARTKRKLFTR